MKLFDEFLVHPDVQKIMHFIIEESQDYTTRLYVRHESDANEELKKECEKILLKTTRTKPSENLVNGLINICKILQTCDSGAYTTYGVVKNQRTGIYHYGGNASWAKGFKKPDDLSHGRLRFNSSDEFQNEK